MLPREARIQYSRSRVVRPQRAEINSSFACLSNFRQTSRQVSGAVCIGAHGRTPASAACIASSFAYKSSVTDDTSNCLNNQSSSEAQEVMSPGANRSGDVFSHCYPLLN
jgi:hypothetical protein